MVSDEIAITLEAPGWGESVLIFFFFFFFTRSRGRAGSTTLFGNEARENVKNRVLVARKTGVGR